MRADTEAAKGGGTTAAVLWLMILIVFLPIAFAHGLARYAAGEADVVHAAVGAPPSGS